MDYYLAIDIGASSGRHILGHMDGGYLRTEEIHRFANGMADKDGHLCWDLETLFAEVLNGLKKCAALDKIPVSVGIDTWGVDFVLLDAGGKIIGDAVAYRDSRTKGCDAEVGKVISDQELYARTGIQKQIINTVYQLTALKAQDGVLEKAASMLMIPDYMHYLLCGVKKTEYTNATTTGLVNAAQKNWDYELIERCGFPKGIFCEIVQPGTPLGGFTEAIRDIVGFSCEVVLPPTHDTAGAFLSVPATSRLPVYISSGTWSLMGVETAAPITSEESREANFTNEGAYGGRYRYLKNIMGLWMIQSARGELVAGIEYEQMIKLAKSSEFQGTVNVNSPRFLAPKSMLDAVREECRETGQPRPANTGDILKCIYASLALSYSQTLKELERLTDSRYTIINVVGGGCGDVYLNELTAKACGLPVRAGPSEGTAIGNIISQMLRAGELSGVENARRVVRASVRLTTYHGRGMVQ